jgi:hypothetical protein
MKQILIFVGLFFSGSSFGQNLSLPFNNYLSPLPTSDLFSYNSNPMTNYGIKWTFETPTSGSPAMWASGFAGIRLFTNREPRLSISGVGNVGINTIDPDGRLHIVQAAGSTPAIRVTQGVGAQNPYIIINGDLSTLKMQSLTGNTFSYIGTENNTDLRLITNNAPKLSILNTGNVGIGITTPAAKLDVYSANNNARFLFDYNNTGNHYMDGISHNFRNTAGDVRFSVQNTSVNAFIPIIAYQRVLIGTTDAPSGYLLAINGNAIANKVVVKQYPWADFVFKPDYKLPPLSMVEQHIKEKGHLPDIPSEKEVAENGIDLGSMDAKLLQKVEELTLYLIEMKKENDNLKKQNQEILKRLEKVEKN